MFGNIGFLEISIIALILLVLFGAKRIPKLFASFGEGIRQLKHSFDSSDELSEGDERSSANVSRDSERIERR
jgi:sec-independent protein translocase protein TatA